MNLKSIFVSLGLAATFSLNAAQAAETDLVVKFVDVGAGLCVLSKGPESQMVYDAGHWDGQQCLKAARSFFDKSEPIDLMVLSHSDGDHIGDAAEILNEFEVSKILRTGHERETGAWKDMAAALKQENGIEDINLARTPLQPGERFILGDATAYFVAGWHDWTETSLNEGEDRNAISIVIRLEYGGTAVLLTGDTIGRRLNDPDDACKDAEAWMVKNQPQLLDADVLQAPHHGGNNGSSSCFIKAVSPQWVVFSAGHKHDHPTYGAADRYMAAGVKRQNMLRTDRGDDEGGYEWEYLSADTCKDESGDDSVTLVISEQGEVQIAYDTPYQGC